MGTMWYEGVTTTVEFEANNNKYKIICCLGCEITGDSAIIVTGDIYYVVPVASLIWVSTVIPSLITLMLLYPFSEEW